MTTSTTALNTGLTIERVFSKEGVDPISEIEWSTRDAVIYDASGKVVFDFSAFQKQTMPAKQN